ncbi:MAG TPA: hypothetical protein VEZ11_14285 [Thermoanaerobaculia bacterium]|nr:hypothetical protein [Thermoanaerobaculia bacterium]
MNLNGLQRSAIVAILVKEYRARNAFCGETLVQKSVYLLQELLGVPLGFDYQLYIYGPFSFELQRHLASMMADDMIAVRPTESGATFEPAAQTAYLETHVSKTIAANRRAIEFAVRHLAGRGVKQLERLATALYFTVSANDPTVDGRAAMIRQVKPHISADEARKAVEQIDQWREECQ